MGNKLEYREGWQLLNALEEHCGIYYDFLACWDSPNENYHKFRARKLSAYAEFFEDTVKDKEENDLRINILELADFMKETISTFKLIQFGKREFSREEIVQKNERLRKEYNELLEKKIRPTYKELEKQLGVD
jgi:hypothetical protein